MKASEIKKVEKLVFNVLGKMEFDELNKLFGSETCDKIYEISRELKYGNFCKQRGIRVDEMTDDDLEDFYYFSREE